MVFRTVSAVRAFWQIRRWEHSVAMRGQVPLNKVWGEWVATLPWPQITLAFFCLSLFGVDFAGALSQGFNVTADRVRDARVGAEDLKEQREKLKKTRQQGKLEMMDHTRDARGGAFPTPTDVE